jgi:uncharacterized protein (TIGR00369 family)
VSPQPIQPCIGLFTLASDDAVQKFRQFFQLSRQSLDIENHFSSLGLKVLDIQSGWASMTFESVEKLAGNPVTGAVASGPLIALLDTCCAMAAATCGDTIRLSPTLDLRVDFLGPAQAKLPVFAEAKAYRNSRFVIFTQGLAFQDNKDKPIARCTINFTPIDQKIFKDKAANGGAE